MRLSQFFSTDHNRVRKHIVRNTREENIAARHVWNVARLQESGRHLKRVNNCITLMKKEQTRMHAPERMACDAKWL